jgi:hypothetical protein
VDPETAARGYFNCRRTKEIPGPIRRLRGFIPSAGAGPRGARRCLPRWRVPDVAGHDLGGIGIGGVEAELGSAIEGLLADGDGEPELRGDWPCQRPRLLHEQLGCYHAADEAESARLLGRDELAREQHLHRRLARDGARQRHHRRRAEQSDIDIVDREPRRARRHREVAGGDELAAGRGRGAAHGRDHRLGQAGRRPSRIARRAPRSASARDSPASPGGRGPRRSKGTGAGDHHHLDRGLADDGLELPLERRHQRDRERVALRRPVEGRARRFRFRGGAAAPALLRLLLASFPRSFIGCKRRIVQLPRPRLRRRVPSTARPGATVPATCWPRLRCSPGSRPRPRPPLVDHTPGHRQRRAPRA